ncbi:unnamed protein product [Gongylonema pulchrum]|uniref:TM2 domain-containing protein n=1 Tax=Gongylonema pulchrum TaxID=637853 RepID=A0A183DZV9_9BILA|nr:unnamed protein product [Gongylonema pulchrum]
MNALRARLLLMFGGPLGLHLLYLHEPLEAYVYFATFGFFLLGVFFDVFTLNGRVAEQNRKLEGFEKNRSCKVKTSLGRFLAQFLFGCFIGFLFSCAGVLLFGTKYRALLALIVAAGITQVKVCCVAGVYVVGNCREQQRSLLYILVSAIASSIATMVLLNLPFYRAVLLVSISATFAGNRSAQSRSFVEQPSSRSYLVLSLIHSFIVLIIAIGLTRVVLDRRISVVTGSGESRVIASVGSIIHDRYFRHPAKDVFHHFSRIEYLPPRRTAVLDQTPQRDGDYGLFDYIVVFIVDFMRYDSSARKRVDDGPNALQLAVWRTFVLQQDYRHSLRDDASCYRRSASALVFSRFSFSVPLFWFVAPRHLSVD